MLEDPVYAALKEQLQIDPLRLSEELMGQPMLVQTAAEHAAEAIQRRDEHKFRLVVAQADAARLMRGNPDDNGKAPSEAAIASRLPLHASVQAAQTALDEAQRTAAVWMALVDSFREKGSALRRTSEMLLAGFMSPNSAHEARRAEIREASAKVMSDGPRLRGRRV